MTNEEQQIYQGSRLEIFHNSLKMNGKSFAKHLGVSQSLISSTCSGAKPITHTLVNKITQRNPELNIHWLFTGTGPMLLPTYKYSYDQLNEPDAGYEKAEEPRELLRIWMESFDARIKEMQAEQERMKKLMGE